MPMYRPIQQTNALSVTWPTVGQQKICCVLPFNIVFQCTAFNCFNTGTIKGTPFHYFPRDDKTVKVCTFFFYLHTF